MKLLPLVYRLAAVTMVTAHFQLQYPTPRGFAENTMTQSPCGGLPPSKNRNSLPLYGSFAIVLYLYQSQTTVEVLLALSSDPGNVDFFPALMKPFQVSGEGVLCLPHVKVHEKTSSIAFLDGTHILGVVIKSLVLA
ncbi:hypothetical protein N7513_002703 [Penicillium frequentans]|nr:hypothetical protein N7513_002703 [Penicillium glabrum]